MTENPAWTISDKTQKSNKTGQLKMITQTKQCFESCVLILVLVVVATKVSSQAEVNGPNSVTEDQSYFFYQQSAYPRDCLEVLGKCLSSDPSGVYAIKPDGYPEAFDVYCDSDGYTVIERRRDGLTSFNRSWEDYASGFGFLSREFWLGNQRLSYLTNQKKYQLRIDVTLSDASSFYVTYDSFRISDGHSSYRVISTGQHNATIVTCPNNMVSSTCSCQRSCADPDTCTTSSCHVTGSCVCPSGFLMNDGYCIPKSQCGCFMVDVENGRGTVLQEGGIYVSPDCGRRCSCTSGQLECEDDFQCSPHASCEQGINGWNCSCNAGYKGDGSQCTPIAVDCQDVFNNSHTGSGVYNIHPSWSQDPIQVYCNMADGGGWTVFQRQDGSDNFNRDWADYKNGFGSPDRGMWLGNDKIHNLTNQKDYELRIDLTDNSGRSYYATYSLFRIGDETSKYTLLSVGSFSGNTGYDRLSWHVNKMFSTHDQDNDDWNDFDCAEQHQGGWWFGQIYRCTTYYSSSYCRSYCPSYEGYCDYFPVGNDCAICAPSHLNANYHSTTRGRNIFWSYLSGYDCGLQYTEMRIRPVQT